MADTVSRRIKAARTQLFGRLATLELLYQASVNGFSNATFHSLCDDQGYTLTVVVLPSGSLVGGFTTLWQNRGLAQDNSSFVYRIAIGTSVATKFLANANAGAVRQYAASSSGPVFGNTNTLCVNLDSRGSSHCRDGGGFINASSAAVTAKDLLANEQLGSFTDVLVFQVKPSNDKPEPVMLSEPWLKGLTFDENGAKALILKVKSLVSLPSQVPCLNILLLGPPGAGKSSFVNTIVSAFANRVKEAAQVGRATGSLTTTFNKHLISGWKEVAFYDTRGWEPDAYDASEMVYLLEGNLTPGMSLKETITSKTTGFRRDPTLADEMHVVVFVVPAAEISDEANRKRIDQTLKLARQRNIRVVLLLTHIDSFDKDVRDKVSNVATSGKVFELVRSLDVGVGIPASSIAVVVNAGCVPGTDETAYDRVALALRALKVIIERAVDTLDTHEPFAPLAKDNEKNKMHRNLIKKLCFY